MMGNNLIDYFNAVFKVLAFEKEEELNCRSKTDSRYRWSKISDSNSPPSLSTSIISVLQLINL